MSQPTHSSNYVAFKRSHVLLAVLAVAALLATIVLAWHPWHHAPTNTGKPAAPPAVSTTDPNAVQPVVAQTDIATCGTIRTWKNYVDCVNKVAPWTPAEFDKSKDVSKLSWANVQDWSNRFPDADARVIFVYNWSDITDDQARVEAVKDDKNLDPTAAKQLRIVRVERDFPGWYVMNTRHLEQNRMDPFQDQRPHQVRVSLAPLDANGQIDPKMDGAGVFVTCFNKHWLETAPATSTAPTTGTVPPGTPTTSVCTTCCGGCVTTTVSTTPPTTPPTTTPPTTTTTQPPCTPPPGNTSCMPPKTPDGYPPPTDHPSAGPPVGPVDSSLTPEPNPGTPGPVDAPASSAQVPTATPVPTYSPSTVPSELPPATSTQTAVVSDPDQHN
jgi:hypothetical protein